jgi:Zn-dependent M28 family amino/carboxypeptidase
MATLLACGNPVPPEPSPTQPTPQPAPQVSTGLTPTAASIREMTAALADDAMDGRRPGTPGGARAVAYIIDQMKRIGLSPGGENGEWTQPVPMREVQTDGARTKVAFTTPNGKQAVRFADDIVLSTFAAPGTQQVDAPLVFAGYGITAPEHRWDDYDGIDVSGKIVVVFVGDPPVMDGRFAGDALTYYGRWSYKFEEAQRHGAAGVLIIHETEAASYGWNVIHTSWTHGRTQVEAAADEGAALAVVGWITTDVAKALATACGTSLDEWHRIAMDAAFTPPVLDAKLVGEFVTTEEKVTDVNVIGRLEGSRWPQQAVAITAHWDHLGHAPTVDGAKPDDDAIFNGAIDNASGVASMLAVASELHQRASSGRPLGRSILFIATTGEEEGLLGSTWYASHPTVPLADIAGVVNLDSTNVDGRTRTVQVIGPGQTSLEDVLAEVAEAEGRTVVPDAHPGSGGYYRSDHFSFARRGVPAIYLRGGAEMEDGGTAVGERLGQARAAHYHTVDDEMDPAWTFAGTLQDVHTVASLVGRVADTEAMPTWKPTSEFSNVDRTAAR